MGNLSTDMQALVADIAACRQMRQGELRQVAEHTKEAVEAWRSRGRQSVRVALSEIRRASQQVRATVAKPRSDARDLNRSLGEQRRSSSRGLRRHLAAECGVRVREHQKLASTRRQERVEGMRSAMHAIRSTGSRRRASVCELLSGARSLVGQYRVERGNTVGSLRDTLTEHRASVTESVQGTRNSVRESLNGLRSEIRRARRAWREQTWCLPQQQPTGAEQAPNQTVSAAGPEAQARSQTDEEGVLAVVESRPEGIRLVDIGNEVGVDWRTLIGATRSLLDLGKIEKIDKVYYPKGARPQLKGEDG